MQKQVYEMSASHFAFAHAVGTLEAKEYAIDPASLGRFACIEAFTDWLASDSFDEAAYMLRAARSGGLGLTALELSEVTEFIQSLGERETSFQFADDHSLRVLNEAGLGLKRCLPRPPVAGAISDDQRADRRRLLQRKRRAKKRIHERQASKARFSACTSKALSLSPKARKLGRSN